MNLQFRQSSSSVFALLDFLGLITDFPRGFRGALCQRLETLGRLTFQSTMEASPLVTALRDSDGSTCLQVNEAIDDVECGDVLTTCQAKGLVNDVPDFVVNLCEASTLQMSRMSVPLRHVFNEHTSP